MASFISQEKHNLLQSFASFLLLKSDKMAKSAGTLVPLEDVQKQGFDPLTYRYLCLTAHYRSELNFSWESLQAAANAFANLREIIADLKSNLNDDSPDSNKIEPIRTKLRSAINEDLNIPGAVGLLWSFLRSPELSDIEKYGTGIVS